MTAEQKVYTYILNNSPLKLDYDILSNDLSMSKSHLYKIVSQLFSKESIKKYRNENGDSILVANSDKTINNNWKDVYIEQLEQMLIQTHYITEDKLNQFKNIIKEQYRE